MKFVGRIANVVRRAGSQVGVLALLAPTALASGLLLATNCSPGTIDCEAVEGEAPEFCGGGGASGNTGGTDDMGGMGGMAPSGPCGDLETARNTAVEGCGDSDTIAKVETDFLQMRCGKNSTCHNGAFEPRFRKADTDLFLKFAGVRAKTLCADNESFYVDLTDATKSFMLTKTAQESPTCPADDAETAGEQMPYQEDVLSADDLACLEGYVKAVAAACQP